jgi:hypothetical protein
MRHRTLFSTNAVELLPSRTVVADFERLDVGGGWTAEVDFPDANWCR